MLLSAQAWQYRDRRKPEVRTMPLSNDFQGFLKCTHVLPQTALSLKKLQHCVCTNPNNKHPTGPVFEQQKKLVVDAIIQ